MEKTKSEVLTEYYEKHSKNMLQIATAILHDSFEAEAAVQDTFAAATKKYDQFISSKNPVGWLYETLRYMTLRLLHERALVKDIVPYTEEICSVGKEDSYSLFTEYQGIIPDMQLSLLIDFHSGKYSGEELAKKYGKSLTNIRVILSRSRAKFREQFQKEMEKYK